MSVTRYFKDFKSPVAIDLTCSTCCVDVAVQKCVFFPARFAPVHVYSRYLPPIHLMGRGLPLAGINRENVHTLCAATPYRVYN